MKQVRLIKTNTDFIGYPVGCNIKTNMSIMNALAKFYTSIAPKGVHNIFCQGASGIIMATIFAQHLPESVIMPIRKSGEFTHAPNSLYNINPTDINIIVDDFICTGDTVVRIYESMTSMMIGCKDVHAVIMGKANVLTHVLDMHPRLFIAGSFAVPIPQQVSFEEVNLKVN